MHSVAAVAVFADLGLEEEGRAASDGPRAQQVTGIDGMRTEIVMTRAPDGSGRLEISRALPRRDRGGLPAR